MITEADILKIFEDSNALLKGHFLLSSGLHSDKYLQCALVLQRTDIASKLCSEIAGEFKDNSVDVVVSPAIGGIIVGQEVARALKCRAIFCEKEDGKMVFRRGFSVEKGSRALVVEDVVTTGGSIKRVADTVASYGGNVIGYGCIVDRSGEKQDFELNSLLKVHVKTYKPQECPMCKEGIAIRKPGSK